MTRISNNTPDAVVEGIAEFSEELGPIGDDFDRAQPPLDAEVAFAGVFERIEAEDSQPLSKLKSQPTWVRRAIALSVIAVIVMIAGPLAPRADIGTYPVVRMALHVGALLGLAGLCAWVALKPLHVPAWSHAKCWAAIGFATSCTFILCVLPQVESTMVGSAGGCFAFGTLLSIPIFAFVRQLDRGAVLSAVLAGAAGGLVGNVVLQLHCPVTERGHLLTGHFLVLVAFVLVGVTVRLWRYPRSRA